MEDEAELLMAVYARYGLATHYCSMIEWDVLTLMMAARMRRSLHLDLSDVNELLEGAYRDIVEDLLSDVRDDVPVPEQLSHDLVNSFAIRNRLARGYFRERTLDLLTTEGRVKMLQEMNKACQLLQTIHESLVAMTTEVSAKHGISKDVLLEELRKVIGVSPGDSPVN